MERVLLRFTDLSLISHAVWVQIDYREREVAFKYIKDFLTSLGAHSISIGDLDA